MPLTARSFLMEHQEKQIEMQNRNRAFRQAVEEVQKITAIQ